MMNFKIFCSVKIIGNAIFFSVLRAFLDNYLVIFMTIIYHRELLYINYLE